MAFAVRGLLALLAVAVAVQGKPPPHIIFNVVDDLGWNDVGFHNPRQIKTPFINQLATTEGIQLSRYYVYRFCSPSRSTFLTGRFPHHLGQQTSMNLNPTPGIACGINLKYKFIADVLQRGGYATHALGKWHQGFQSPAYTPTLRGFESYLGYYSGAEEHFSHLKMGAWPQSNYFDLTNNSGSSLVPDRHDVGTNGTYSVYLYGNETLRILRSHDQSKPLYLYLAWNVVHDPNEAPEEYIDHNADINNKDRQALAAMVNCVDDSMNTIVQEMKRLGMWENTLWVFTTDNGGNLGGAGNNFPLRGGKYTFWEGGTRGVGFIAGGVVPSAQQGSVYSGLMHSVDWYVSFAALAGVSVDNTGPIDADGQDVISCVLANHSCRNDAIIQIASTDENSKPLPNTTGVVIDLPYKLIVGYPGWKPAWDGWIQPDNFSLHGTGPDDDMSLPVGEVFGPCDKPCACKPCLYNIVEDPTEHNDIAAGNQAIVERLHAKILAAAKTEVSVKESGLCPTEYGIGADPRCLAKAKELGFWEPWLKDTSP